MPFSLLDTLNALLLPLALVAVLVILVYLWASSQQGARARRPRAGQPAAAREAGRAPAPGSAAARPADTGFADTDVDEADFVAIAAPTPPAPTAPPAAAAAPARPLSADVLVVDDSAVVRAKLQRLMLQSGYRVETANNGRQALERLQQGRYGLLITDLEMPEMDGFALVQALQADPALAALPVLAITGHENLQAQLRQCAGVLGIHRKPWIDDVLRDDVGSILRSAPMGLDAA